MHTRTVRKSKVTIMISCVLVSITLYVLKGNFSFNVNRNETISILFYTPFFGTKPWSFEGSYDLTKNCGCHVSKCQFSYDARLFNQSDVILFSGRDLPDYNDMLELARKKPPSQLWGFFSMESSVNTPSVSKFDTLFDFSSTYHLDSDVRAPYRYHFLKEVNKKRGNYKQSLKSTKNYFKSKTRSVAWIVSNCQPYERNLLAESLLHNGVKLEVSGRCSQIYNHTFTCEKKSCEVELAEFKFYFAAENSLCTDYITEKYWFKAIDSNTIPIVLGGANYDNENLAIPGSYINAFDFHSPKALADYIKLVEVDEKRFNSYFDWKNDWDVSPIGCSQYSCSLCDKIRLGISPNRKSLNEIFHIGSCFQATSKFTDWIKK